MWTRAELKERAKGCLRRYYWAAFLVSLIFSIVSAFSGVSVDSDSMDYFSGGGSAGISARQAGGMENFTRANGNRMSRFWMNS